MATTEELSDAWDAGEQHPSSAHPIDCWPHKNCNPYSPGELADAFNGGVGHEENYLMTWGQFDPSGHLCNPHRYPPKPLVSDAEVVLIMALHGGGKGTRAIARETGIKRPLVMATIRNHQSFLTPSPV